MDRGRTVHLERRRQARLPDPVDEGRRARLSPAAARYRPPRRRRSRAPRNRRSSVIASRPAASTASNDCLRLVGRRAEDLTGSTGLDDHHADGVGDDVVQLARDVPALLGRRDAHALLPFADGPFDASARRSASTRRDPEDIAQEPGRDEDDERQDEPLDGARILGEEADGHRSRPR